jgi:hypothetical protein
MLCCEEATPITAQHNDTASPVGLSDLATRSVFSSEQTYLRRAVFIQMGSVWLDVGGQ